MTALPGNVGIDSSGGSAGRLLRVLCRLKRLYYVRRAFKPRRSVLIAILTLCEILLV